MFIKPGNHYYFSKSGNEVRAIAPAPAKSDVTVWEVERTKGASAGKRMLVPSKALIPVELSH